MKEEEDDGDDEKDDPRGSKKYEKIIKRLRASERQRDEEEGQFLFSSS